MKSQFKALLLLLAFVMVGTALNLALTHNWFSAHGPAPTQATFVQQAPQIQPKPIIIDPNGRSPGAIDPNGNGSAIEPNGH